MKQRPVYVIIVAAGTGSRFGADLPKQFCMLAGRPVLCHAVDRVRRALPGARVITVISPSMRQLWEELAAADGLEMPPVVEGGATRWESVRNALAAIDSTDPDAVVLVHDAARPLLDTSTARAVVEAAAPGISAVPVIPVTDSLRFVNSEGVSVPVDRADFRAVVTPQGFMLDDLRRAYRLPYTPAFTDDASVMMAAGMPEAELVDATPALLKITHPGDLALAAWYLTHGL